MAIASCRLGREGGVVQPCRVAEMSGYEPETLPSERGPDGHVQGLAGPAYAAYHHLTHAQKSIKLRTTHPRRLEIKEKVARIIK